MLAQSEAVPKLLELMREQSWINWIKLSRWPKPSILKGKDGY